MRTSFESIYSKRAEGEGREAAELKARIAEVQQAVRVLAAVSSQKEPAERLFIGKSAAERAETDRLHERGEVLGMEALSRTVKERAGAQEIVESLRAEQQNQAARLGRARAARDEVQERARTEAQRGI